MNSCKFCGNSFTPRSGSGGSPQKFCSTSCGITHWKHQRTLAKILKNIRECEECGKIFTPDKYNIYAQKFCSMDCNNAFKYRVLKLLRSKGITIPKHLEHDYFVSAKRNLKEFL